MRIVVLHGQSHKGSTYHLAKLFCDKLGGEVTEFFLPRDFGAFCVGCSQCFSKSEQLCPHADQLRPITEALDAADVIVLASPVYFYSIDAQLKAVIDRTVARWLEVRDKEFYYIVTMADEANASADTTLACFRGYADCVEGAVEKGVIIGSGVYEPDKVKQTPAMERAYQTGKAV